MSAPEKPNRREKLDSKLMENTPNNGPGGRRSPISNGVTAANGEVQTQIGRQLRSIYNDVLNQPIPDRFLDLLQKLDDDKRDK